MIFRYSLGFTKISSPNQLMRNCSFIPQSALVNFEDSEDYSFSIWNSLRVFLVLYFRRSPDWLGLHMLVTDLSEVPARWDAHNGHRIGSLSIPLLEAQDKRWNFVKFSEMQHSAGRTTRYPTKSFGLCGFGLPVGSGGIVAAGAVTYLLYNMPK